MEQGAIAVERLTVRDSGLLCYLLHQRMQLVNLETRRVCRIIRLRH